MWIAGVDGCRGGWVVALAKIRRAGVEELQIRLCRQFRDVLSFSPRPRVIAVDIPIGLLDEPTPGGRLCDREARRLLGRRASSVFTPPTRQVIAARDYAQVRTTGLSCQSFNILPKIREVDRLMTPQLQRSVREAHPELVFSSLAGHPMRFNKKTPQGRRERLHAMKVLPVQWRQGMLRHIVHSFTTFPRTKVAPDDLLDAAVLAWAAFRITEKKARRVPANPTADQRGLRMEIWF